MKMNINCVKETLKTNEPAVSGKQPASCAGTSLRAKPKMAGNKSFRKHNKLKFFRTKLRSKLGKGNRL